MKEAVQWLDFAWLDQPGRNRSLTGSVSDGFVGRDALAGVVVLADGPPELLNRAGLAAAAIRDTFTEGVVYGIDDALTDVIASLNTEESMLGISLAAAAGSGNELWVYCSGRCSILLSSITMKPRTISYNHSVEKGRIQRLSLEPGQHVLLFAGGESAIPAPDAIPAKRDRKSESASEILSRTVDSSGIRFRDRGCSIACVKAVAKPTFDLPVSKRSLLYSLLALISVILILLLVCTGRNRNSLPDEQRVPSESPMDSSETVMPIRF